MVKLLSSLALYTLIITPAFASALFDLETRDPLFVRELDEAEASVFVRDLQGLFARQHDPEHVVLARRAQSRDNIPHAPFARHQLPPGGPPADLVGRDFDDEVLERNLDYELYIRHLIDEDLYGRFYDDDLD